MGEHKHKAVLIRSGLYRQGVYGVGGRPFTLTRNGTVHAAIVMPGRRVHNPAIVDLVRKASQDAEEAEKRRMEEAMTRATATAAAAKASPLPPPAPPTWWQRVARRLRSILSPRQGR